MSERFPVMQRETERRRVVVDGRRTDDGDQCTFVAVHETGGTWALYPHGVGQLGVRLTGTAAAALAAAMMADGSR
ncbi:MAG: hypothetical protein ABR608_08340 [Pseudonocardiaceae bacterium]